MCNYIPYNQKITSIKKLDYERNPMKKIFAFLTIVSLLFFYYFYKTDQKDKILLTGTTLEQA